MLLVRKFLFTMLATCLTGCGAEYLEKMADDGTAPAGSPPGYYLFKQGKKLANEKNIQLAENSFCQSAKLGNPEAKNYCVYYAFLYSRQYAPDICKAAPYDTDAKNICGNLTYTKDGLLKARAQVDQLFDYKREVFNVIKNIKAKKYDLQFEDV